MSEEQKIENLYVEPVGTIERSDVTQDPESGIDIFSDKAATKLVLDDLEYSENFVNVLQWASYWSLADILYQSPASASAFDGGNVAQANVPKFHVSNHISSIVPKIMSGIFYEDPPFLLRPRPGTTQDVVRAKTALFSYQLDDMKFEEETERTLEQMALLGTGIMKWGYTEHKKTVKKHVRKAPRQTVEYGGKTKYVDTPESDDFEIIYKDKLVSRPWIKYCDIRTVFVDPGCRYGDIRRSKYVVYRDYATFYDLDNLRSIDGYTIPDEETLKAVFFSNKDVTPGADNISMTIPENMRGYIQHAVPRNYKTTSDPLQRGLEILERWDADKVIVVLSCNGHNILIRNEENPYERIPFLSANWRNIPDSFYGQGIGILIGSEQLVHQGVTNLALDLLAYGLQPTAVRKKGFNVPTQATRWKLGGIIDVDDDVDKAFKFMTMPPVPGEAWAFINQANSDAATSSGANEQVIQGAGAAGVKTTGMRSATGAAAVIQANASRLDGPTGRFVRQVFEPWLYIMDELNNDLLPSSVLRDVLGEELGEAFDVDHEQFRDAKIEYEVLAGARLGAKKEMAQFLPIMMQMMTQPALTQMSTDAGYMWNVPAIIKAMADAAGWKFTQEFYVPMTPEQKQKRDMNSPVGLQARQAQAQQQAQLQQFQHEQQLEDAKQLGKAANEVLRQTTEKALTPEEVTGEAGGEGFGSTTAL